MENKCIKTALGNEFDDFCPTMTKALSSNVLHTKTFVLLEDNKTKVSVTTPQKTKKTPYATLNFCPFCGEDIKTDYAEESSHE